MVNDVISAIHSQLHQYFDALYFCDVNRLQQVFHPDAIYINATDHPLLKLEMASYFSIVEKRISPASQNALRQDKVVSINLIYERLAIVHVECAIQPKYFYDALTLIYEHQQWKIISKVFQYEIL
ncbi:nuclear transport factor 2 family protein [Acinetobacter higginsii]|uniref:nuclear transport factor 2 family protein n=1 Tax=Acinetobacter higginsii TaxID=70347 RepID=UPI00300B07F9